MSRRISGQALAALLLIVAANIPRGALEAAEPAPDPVSEEVRAVIQAQQEAWNRGDIDAFMNGYWRSDATVFVSGDDVTRGWQTVRDRYKTKYSDREKMGRLIFSDLEITALGTGAAVALGRWELKRAKDNPHGRFTLIFRQTPDGWRIVHDHTSTAEPPHEKLQ